jgi:hypothetical protein
MRAIVCVFLSLFFTVVDAREIVQVTCYSNNHMIYNHRVDANKIVIFDNGYLGIEHKKHVTEIKADCIIRA